jgi:transcriptional regulator with XRE-family HTH domain
MRNNSLKQLCVLLGQRIKKLREEKNLSQENFAEKIEMSRTYLAYLETGARMPSLKTLHKIASVLNVTVWELFKV